MAKKKQFAGKKTKLARLPLTQALASQAEEGVVSPPSPVVPLARVTPAAQTWEAVKAGGGGPLAAAILFLARELAELTADLQSTPTAAVVNHRRFLPERVPPEAGMRRALSQARQSLRELQDLLAQSS
jgi:hypothetical protein